MAFNKLKNWIAHIYLMPFKKIFPCMDLRRDIVQKDSSLAEKIIFSLFPSDEKTRLELIKRLINNNERISHELILHYKPDANEKLMELLKELIYDSEYIYCALVDYYTEKNKPLKKRLTLAYLTDNEEERKNIVYSWIKQDTDIQAKLDSDYAMGTRITQGQIERAIYYKESRKLEVSGFFLPISAYDTVEVYSDGTYLGDAQTGIIRKDIYEKFPAYHLKNAGWLMNEQMDRKIMQDKITVVLKRDGQEIFRDKANILVNGKEKQKTKGRFWLDMNGVELINSDVHKRVERFNSICYSLSSRMAWENEKFRKRFTDKKNEIAYGKERVERIFIDIFSDNNMFHFIDADIQYQDADKFWLIINELLIQQEYYFETDVEKPFIIDGGANIGLAVYYFKTLYPQAEIIAFEPSKEAFRILENNRERNNWNNVTLLPYALDIQEQTCELLIPEQDCLGASLTKRAFEYQTGAVRNETVESKPLNAYINGSVDFLKLDVEGVEVRILRGLAEKIQNVQNLFCEYHFGNLVVDNELEELIDILSKNGFSYQLSKSPSYQRTTGKQTMKYVGERYSLNIWAKRN